MNYELQNVYPIPFRCKPATLYASCFFYGSMSILMTDTTYTRSWKITLERQRYPDVESINGSKEYINCRPYGPFHTRIGVWVILIAEDPTLAVKCRTPIKAIFIYFNLFWIIMLDSFSCPFTSISFLSTFMLHLLHFHFG